MPTVRCFYTDTTGYAKHTFRIYRTVEYVTTGSPDHDIPTVTLLCLYKTLVFGKIFGSHAHDYENDCPICNFM